MNGFGESTFEYEMRMMRARSEGVFIRHAMWMAMEKAGCLDEGMVSVFKGGEEMKFSILLAIDMAMIRAFAKFGYSDEQILRKLKRSPLALHRMFDGAGSDIALYMKAKRELQEQGLSPEEVVAALESQGI